MIKDNPYLIDNTYDNHGMKGATHPGFAAGGCNISHRRQPALEVKYDERYVVWGGEDIDFAVCYGNHSECDFYFDIDLVVYHQKHPYNPNVRKAFNYNRKLLREKIGLDKA